MNDDNDEETKVVHAWENITKRSWETVCEDEEGNIVTYSDERERSHRARIKRMTQSIRRGLIRYMVVCIDCSKSTSETDYKPTRLDAVKSIMKAFISEYYDQNPISQCCIAISRDRKAEKISDLSGNIKSHFSALDNLNRCDGLPSLQHMLKVASITLRHVPEYGCKELLIIYGSLSTCDPGDIFETLEELKKMRIRVNVICLSAELYICKHIAEQTGGVCSVAMSANHLNEMIMQQTQPPPEVTLPNAETGKKVTRDTSTFVYMGFPRRTFDKNPAFTYSGRQIVESSVSFVCPRCHNRTLEIPTSCCVCGLQLNSSSHIARSHHHLFPVPNFSEFHNDHDSVTSITSTNGHDSTKSSLATANGSLKLMKSANTMSLKFVKTTTSTIDTTKYSTSSSVQKYCSGCFFPFYDNDNQQNSFNHNSLQMQCPKCLKLFCVECDIFIHDSLHNCPGCNHQELLRS